MPFDVMIKKKSCITCDFSDAVKIQVLKNSDYKCVITGIKFDNCVFTPFFNHKKLICDNSIDNCEPIISSLEQIEKSNKLETFKETILINIFNSLNTSQKNNILSKLKI